MAYQNAPPAKTHYVLPQDDKEFNRLDLQHEMLKIGFNGLNVCNELVNSVLTNRMGEELQVLDLGSGSGSWAIEMARQYPYVKVHGLDLKPREHDETLPSNCDFEVWDINDGLDHHYRQFDFVHCRFTETGFKDHKRAMTEIERCLKPGGLLMFIIATIPVTEERNTPYMPYMSTQTDGSWLQRAIIAQRVGIRNMGSDPYTAAQEVDTGLWKHELIEPATCGAALFTFPVGPWATSSDPAEAERLRTLGELNKRNILIVHHHWRALFDHSKRSEKEWKILIENTERELHTDEHHLSIRVRALWGRRVNTESPPSPYHAPNDNKSSFTGFRLASFYDSEEEWLRLSEEYNSRLTPEMRALMTIPNYDPLE